MYDALSASQMVGSDIRPPDRKGESRGVAEFPGWHVGAWRLDLGAAVRIQTALSRIEPAECVPISAVGRSLGLPLQAGTCRAVARAVFGVTIIEGDRVDELEAVGALVVGSRDDGSVGGERSDEWV